MLAIVGGNLIDGAGAPVLPDAAVLIDGQLIVAAGPPRRRDHPRGRNGV